MGSAKENPISHVSYSYGAQVVILDETGKVDKVVAAYDVGTVVNPQSVEGQIEGGIVMGLGYALTEDFKIEGGYPKVKFGTLGLMRSTDAPKIEVKLVKGKGKIPHAYGAKGVGELCLIPTAPACSHAYYRYDGKLRTKLPLQETFYKK
jgi:CO/xanthine dehydrogenase Mo-binding subunit